jgi:4-hydroxy-3-methylbut-2-enyl diphosphate reductase
MADGAKSKGRRCLIVAPRGFCAGVERAIDIVELALEALPPPLYVRKEIVHNQAVVDGFRERDVVFVDSLEEVPPDSLVIFSAHGVSPAVWEKARERNLEVIDATCPLVTKVHLEVRRFAARGYDIVLIGHAGHDEVVGTMGEAAGRIHLVGTVEEVERIEVRDPDRVAYTTQTTLSVDETRRVIEALRRRFPSIVGPKKDDICYATQNRQDAVKALLDEGLDLLLVVGSDNSSNSQRLCDVAEARGVEAHLIDGPEEVESAWLDDRRTVGLTAGASAPEFLVKGVADLLRGFGFVTEERMVVEEDVHFSLPPELSRVTRA